MTLDTVIAAVKHADYDQTESMTSILRDVAGPSDAHVVIFHAFTSESFEETADRLEYETSGEASADEVASRLSVVRDMRSALEDAGIGVSVAGAIGNPGEEIVTAAEKADAGLVFVGGRRRSPAGKAVFGSTAQEVMLDSPCPVTFVRVD
ncbi:MAG: universal stress protein [Haloarculaceae archaeon]